MAESACTSERSPSCSWRRTNCELNLSATMPIEFSVSWRAWTNEMLHYSAWIPNTDLTPLDPESCKDVSEKGKQKQLIAAYKVAAENHDLQYFKDLLADHQRAIQQEAEDREAKEAAKAAAKAEKEQKKKKRKSAEVAEEPEDVEMAEAGEEEGKKATKATKKRKKDAESEAEAEKVSVSTGAARGSCIRTVVIANVEHQNSLQRPPRRPPSSSSPRQRPQQVRRRSQLAKPRKRRARPRIPRRVPRLPPATRTPRSRRPRSLRR